MISTGSKNSPGGGGWLISFKNDTVDINNNNNNSNNNNNNKQGNMGTIGQKTLV